MQLEPNAQQLLWQKTAITSVMKGWTVCLPTGSGRVAGQVTLITLSGNLKDDTELLWL